VSDFVEWEVVMIRLSGTFKGATRTRSAFIVSCMIAGTLAILVDAGWAESNLQQRKSPEDWVILAVFGIGIGAILVSWIVIPYIFAQNNKLDDLLDLVRHGQGIKFVTVLYVVLIIFTLGLLNLLESSHLSTLLAAIIGYVLGEATARIEREPSKKPAEEKSAIDGKS
jgi:hypothetical protein